MKGSLLYIWLIFIHNLLLISVYFVHNLNVIVLIANWLVIVCPVASYLLFRAVQKQEYISILQSLILAVGLDHGVGRALFEKI
jgi:multisubunit Na+/H+ antiporter MnhG subunit